MTATGGGGHSGGRIAAIVVPIVVVVAAAAGNVLEPRHCVQGQIGCIIDRHTHLTAYKELTVVNGRLGTLA